MLHAGETLGWVIVLIVNMYIVVHDGVAYILREEVVVDEWFSGFRSELHHHAGWCVGIHVGVFTGDVVVLGIDDAHEYVACLRLAGDVTLVTVCDILLGNIFAGTLHELHLDGVLNGLNAHLALAAIRDVVGYLLDKSGIFTLVGMQHGLANGCHDFLFVESNDASVTLYYCLDHFSITFTIDV